MENIHHDAAQFLIDLFKAPGQTLAVLAHLQRGGCHPAGVGRLARRKQHAVALQILGRLKSGGHVSTLGHRYAAVFHQQLGILEQQLILGGAGQRNIALDRPHAAALMILRVRAALDVLADAGTANLLDILNQIQVNAIRIVDPTGGIAQSDHLRTEFHRLLRGINRHVAGAGNAHRLTGHIDTVGLEHLPGEVQQAEAGRLLTGERAAIAEPLAGQHALVVAHNTLILAEEITDLPCAHTDISGRHVTIGADILVQLGHEALTESHDLAVGLAFRIEVGTAFAAADRQAGQGVFEHLLKCQEFDDADIHRRMQAQAALVRTDGVVELHTVAGIDLHLALIVHPLHAEFDLPIRLDKALKQCLAAILFLVGFHNHPQAFQHFLDRLQKLRFRRILLGNHVQDFVDVGHLSSLLKQLLSLYPAGGPPMQLPAYPSLFCSAFCIIRHALRLCQLIFHKIAGFFKLFIIQALYLSLFCAFF